jgi:starch synthase
MMKPVIPARPLRILMVTAELAPLAKTGGLADMVAGLARWLASRGHDVRILLPAYRDQLGWPAATPVGGVQAGPVRLAGTHPGFSLELLDAPAGGPRTYLVDAPPFYAGGALYGHGDDDARRFALLAHAALALCPASGFQPDVFHCHDWHAGLLPLLLQGPPGQPLRQARSLLTIHNIGYQGSFPRSLAGDCGLDAVASALAQAGGDPLLLNFLRAGIARADALSTVSPTHAAELGTPEYGMGLDGLLRTRESVLTGILNGVDYALWDPASDPLIPARYSADDPSGKHRCREALLAEYGIELPDGAPLVGMVSRLARQKGIELVLDALPPLLRSGQASAVILGDGEPGYCEALDRLAGELPGQLRFLRAHDEQLAHRVFAASDLFLVPSLYEPCGLTQMYALRYGAIPVVRATGGLRDTITHFNPADGSGNGSVFMDADSNGLHWGIRQALDWYRDDRLRRQVMANGMQADFSWDRQGPHYEALYRDLAGR